LVETVGFQKTMECVMTNKHECEMIVSSRLKGSDAETAGSKCFADPRNRQQNIWV